MAEPARSDEIQYKKIESAMYREAFELDHSATKQSLLKYIGDQAVQYK